jgi:hypothetical protein
MLSSSFPVPYHNPYYLSGPPGWGSWVAFSPAAEARHAWQLASGERAADDDARGGGGDKEVLKVLVLGEVSL